MDRIRTQITTPVLIGAGVGLLVGLIIGLFFAYIIWPVQWTDLPVSQLRSDLQADYLSLAIQNYAQTGDVAAAQSRWAEMGESGPQVLNKLEANPPGTLDRDTVTRFAAAVKAGPGPVQPGAVATQPAGAAAATPAKTPAGGITAGGTKTTSNSGFLTTILVIMCLLTLVVAGILAYLLLYRKRRPSIAGNRSLQQAVGQAPEQAAYPEGQEPPIVQYLTTYTLGNDLYDDSFSIDSPSGEFLGECGVGISDTIGVGDPKKVTAFEVWLFDKNDIQTVTKVLMSQHAFGDPTINQRLASKGEPVLAEPGKRIVLETATLQLEARVVNMNYGQGALPANSFFEQVTLELAVWPKA
jgi:hypothetical protein